MCSLLCLNHTIQFFLCQRLRISMAFFAVFQSASYNIYWHQSLIKYHPCFKLWFNCFFHVFKLQMWFIFNLWVYVLCPPACMYVPHIVCSAWGDQRRRNESSGTWFTNDYELPCGWWGWRLGPLEEQLSRDSSFHTMIHFLTCTEISITVCFYDINVFKYNIKKSIFKKCDKPYFCLSFVPDSQLLLHTHKHKDTAHTGTIGPSARGDLTLDTLSNLDDLNKFSCIVL